jgi:hypothetical protein
MGCCKSKELNKNYNIGEYIIKLFDENTNTNYKINLDRAIKLYESEKNKLNGGDIDYKTKCIIVMSFIRDIDQIICNNKKILKINDIDKNNYINKYLINIKLPIFITEQLEQYRKNIITDSLLLMKLFDLDETHINKTIDHKLNIMENLINNIHNI